MARLPLHRYFFLSALAAIHPAAAALLYTTFQDHAVLQREVPIPVWGTATPGAAVTVTLTQDTTEGAKLPATAARITAHAGPDGRWRGTLPALPAGGPYTLNA